MLNNFSGLIAKSLDFVNLGKVLADAGPGFILTVAAAVLVGTLAQIPIVPIAVHTTELHGEPCEPDGSWAPSFTPQGNLEEGLVDLKKQICKAEVEFAELTQAKEKAEAEATRRKVVAETLSAQVKKLEEETTSRAIAERFESRLLASKVREMEKEYLAAQGSLATALETQSAADLRFAKGEARLGRLREEFSRSLGLRVSTLSAFVNYLLDHLLLLSFTGWVVGTMMGPLNRALMTGCTKGLNDSFKARVRSTVEHATKDLFERDNEAEHPLSEEQKAEVKRLVIGRRASYFIGRKVISKGEWDDLVTSYYRWAELSSNLVIPLVVLGVSFVAVAGTGTPSEAGSSAWPALAAALASFAVAAMAYKRSQTALVTYHARLAEFLAGRLSYFFAEERQITSLAEAALKAEAALGKVNDALGLVRREDPASWQAALAAWLTKAGWVKT